MKHNANDFDPLFNNLCVDAYYLQILANVACHWMTN